MKTNRGNTLALMFQETSVTIAQVPIGRKKHSAHRVATFDFPTPLSADSAEQLGQSLRSFLRTHRLSARRAVAGVPAKWVVGKPIQIPPTSAENVTSLLAIQAEQAFSINYDDLVVDYSARISPSEANRVLLVAMQRSRLNEIQTLSKSAGLQLVSVTPTAAATSLFSLTSSRTHCGIYVQNQHCDFVLCGGGLLQDIKHIPAPLGEPDAKGLSPDLRRQLLLAGQNHETSDPLEVLLWSDQADSGESLGLLREAVDSGSRVRRGRDALLEVGHVCSEQLEPTYDAAIGLALAQTQTRLPLIDFLNSRLAVKLETSHRKAIVWSCLLGLVLIAVAGTFYWDFHQDKAAVAEYRQALQENGDAHAAALAMKQKIAQASTWYGDRPAYLDCLRELTLAFPERGDIWVRSLSLEADGSGLVRGDAVDRASVNRLSDELMRSEAFAQIENLHTTSIGGNSQNVTYDIRFQYLK